MVALYVMEMYSYGTIFLVSSVK